MSVVLRVWDLRGEVPLGVQRVEVEVAERAQALAQARGLQAPKVSVLDLDLAQVEEQDLEWVLEQVRAKE
jgi:hypothetical protein